MLIGTLGRHGVCLLYAWIFVTALLLVTAA
jgi:hypothetical protein